MYTLWYIFHTWNCLSWCTLANLFIPRLGVDQITPCYWIWSVECERQTGSDSSCSLRLFAVTSIGGVKGAVEGAIYTGGDGLEHVGKVWSALLRGSGAARILRCNSTGVKTATSVSETVIESLFAVRIFASARRQIAQLSDVSWNPKNSSNWDMLPEWIALMPEVAHYYDSLRRSKSSFHMLGACTFRAKHRSLVVTHRPSNGVRRIPV